uniref:Lysosome-associated membrane glycoprotein 2-like luminal domain-containing protein n=1 Tax=Eptatretus burgeri TaxID=7764 RepID=A0A8C4QNS6_EPTBU
MALFARTVLCAICLGSVFALTTSKEPETGDYTLNATDTSTCLKAKMALQLKLTYVVEKKETAVFNIDPRKVTVSGVCGDTLVSLLLNFTNGFIMFTFTKENAVAIIGNIDLKLNYTTAKSIVMPFEASSRANFHLPPLNESYKCNSANELLKGANVTLIASHVQLQPFGVSNNTFSPAFICAHDNMTTSTPVPTNTTPVPTNTTPVPTNTTPVPTNTTTVPTNTTTVPTNTTLTPATTTPSTPPKPMKGNYNVTNKDNQTCLLTVMEIQLVITSSDKKKKATNFNVDPSKVTVSGGCQKNVSYVNLAYNQGNMTFYFKANNKTFYFSGFVANFTNKFPGPFKGLNVSNNSFSLFSTSLGKAYKCSTEQHIHVQKNVQLKLSELKL